MFATLILFAQENGAPPGGAQPNPLMSFLPLLVIMVLFYFLLLRPVQQRERKQREELTKLQRLDEVVTSAGIIGTVHSIKDDEVVLKIDDNARMRVLKSSIARILTSREGGPGAAGDTNITKK